MIHPNSEINPFELIIFGATGDLSMNKIIPALFERDKDGQIPKNSKIVGISRTQLNSKEFNEIIKTYILNLKKYKKDRVHLSEFVKKFTYIPIDIKNPKKKNLKYLKSLLNNDRIRLFYFATAPEYFIDLANIVSSESLITSKTRVIIEKPFGKNYNTANKINSSLNKFFDESQIYRIDHYLGKETVQNLMAMRFANQIFETQWNNKSIDHIQITVAETKSVYGREKYYDSSGAIRDMLQNHLLQLVCLVAMEPPIEFESNQIRNEKLKVLMSLKTFNLNKDLILGQYGEGIIKNQKILSYKKDSKNSFTNTETFVALKLFINNWRWAGVPFYIRTGKRLKKQASEIVISFKKLPHFIFDMNVSGSIEPNKLIIRLQPDEGLKLSLMSKEPGPGGLRLKKSFLNLSFADTFKKRIPDAYERLLMDIVRGNQTLFMRKDEVENSWKWIDPIVNFIEEENIKPHIYQPGTWGPEHSKQLLKDDGRLWIDP